MNYAELGQEIQSLVGGSNNVDSFTNCMTRLRLNLKDPSLADAEAIKQLDGVMGVVEGEQLQVVVGVGHAERLRQEYEKIHGNDGGGAAGGAGAAVESRDIAADTRKNVKSKQTTKIQRMFQHVGNIFVPVIPGFISCGIILAIANLLKMVNPDIATHPWFGVLAGIGGIFIGALHFIVGHNTAKEFGGTPVLGFIAGGLPYMTALAGIPAADGVDAQPVSIPIFGDLAPGLGGIIGVLITAWFFTVIEKRVRKVTPAALDLFIVPVVTLAIGAAFCLFIIMPISSLLMKGLTWLLVDFALQTGGVIGGFIMATFFLPMVMLGIHQGLTPIHAQLISDHGFTELLPILAMGGAAQVGMAIAVFLRTDNPKLKTAIKSAFPIGVLGIGEPLIYGVSLPMFRPFITACIGGGFGGAFIAWGMQQAGLFGAGTFGLSGLLMIPVITAGQWLWYLGGWAIAVVAGALITYFFGYRKEDADRVYGTPEEQAAEATAAGDSAAEALAKGKA
ncbi:PTS transporter subunit EIIC [Corynebacterium endometrii]|uniref:PTS system EIIBC component n=1 Tax=Corynebacterium endometrii TaxID=2488819 RepID=A0A4P7QDE1_9CORY|nr:PTS transporter subunit EIIC [Corynebacterium endometrii]QCB27389.1 PTS system EIIBC component [Corynebacterium endometrii]